MASETFSAFFEQWMIHQELYLQQLLLAMEGSASRNDEDNQQQQQCNDLISRIVAHYAEYFEAKAEILEEDVFLVLTPTWLTLFERTYLWLGGFRPGLAFHIVTTNVSDLRGDQSQRITALMSEIKEEENQVMNEHNRVLEDMVSPSMLEIARQVGRLRNGEENRMEAAIDRLKESMLGLVKWADFLRRKTAVMLLEILKPTQAVRFLAAVAHVQLKLHRWGLTHTDM